MTLRQFKQQAYYIGNKELFFVDRSKLFIDEKAAELDLASFACRTINRIPNRQYLTRVYEEIIGTKEAKTVNDLLAEKLI